MTKLCLHMSHVLVCKHFLNDEIKIKGERQLWRLVLITLEV